MYVKINNIKVLYDGAADDLLLMQWQMWYIDLTSLEVSNVTSLSIGFDRVGTNGGMGKVLIDDIRLYAYDRRLITPKNPGTMGMQAWYQFEGDTSDSSPNARNASVMGNPSYIEGKVGQAISLDGSDDSVNIDGYKGILADAAGQRMNLRVDTYLRVEHGNGNIRGTNGPSLIDDQWHHVAATVPQAGRMMDVKLYVDGADVTPVSTTAVSFNLTANVDVAIGMAGPSGGRFFLGLIDDVHIYDRVLSVEEIAWLAGRTLPYDKPF